MKNSRAIKNIISKSRPSDAVSSHHTNFVWCRYMKSGWEPYFQFYDAPPHKRHTAPCCWFMIMVRQIGGVKALHTWDAGNGSLIIFKGEVKNQSPEKTNLPKENRIPIQFHIGIVSKLGKTKRKQIHQKNTNPQFICRH